MSFHQLVKATLFGADKTDSEVTTCMVWTGFVFTVCQFVISIVQPAPYGRYAQNSPRYLNCKFSVCRQKKPIKPRKVMKNFLVKSHHHAI